MREKSPAFQWYPKDFLSDENVVLMTLEEEGAYRRLMDYCWLQGSIPDDTKSLSMLCKGISVERMAVLWSAIKHCFLKREERWFHPRLEREKTKQNKHRKAKVNAGSFAISRKWLFICFSICYSSKKEAPKKKGFVARKLGTNGSQQRVSKERGA